MALLEVKNLGISFGGLRAVNGFDISIEKEALYGLIGPNGAGKTTVFNLLTGVYKPDSGKVLLDGTDITGKNTIEINKAGIARTFQNIRLFKQLSVLDNVKVGLHNKHHYSTLSGVLRLPGYRKVEKEMDEQAMELLKVFNLEDVAHVAASNLPYGQQRRLEIARAMATEPKLLLLDEPAAGMNPNETGELMDMIRFVREKFHMTILLIEHRLEEVLAYADRVLVMENGGILALDAPEKLPAFIRENDMFQAMPVPMRIFEELSGEGDSPVTVREGREWLEEWREEKKTSESICKNQAETVEKMSDDRDRELAEKLSDTQESETVDTPVKGRKTSLFGLFSKKSAKGSDDQQPQTVLEARDVWFRYEKELPDVVRDLNLKVQKGELYCLLGGNGTGKSTTLRLLGRIKKPYRGKLFLNGKELGTYRESELYGKLLGILPQNPQSLFVKDTVEKDLREMSGDTEHLRDVIEKTEIRHLLGSHPYDLSGGEQQRAALAKVLLLDPEIILLDEPTKGLDGFYKKKLAQILKGLTAEGKTILMVSHDIEFCAEYGDTCALFFHGSVVTSAPAREFFAGNSFYTTAANRMARKWYPDAVTAKDVIEGCRR